MTEPMSLCIGNPVPKPFSDLHGEGSKIVMFADGLVFITIRYPDFTDDEVMDINSSCIETGVMRSGRYWIGLMRFASLTIQLYFDITKLPGEPPSLTKSSVLLAIDSVSGELRTLRLVDLPPKFLDSWRGAIDEYTADCTGYREGYDRFCDLIDSMPLNDIWDACEKTGVMG